MTAYNGYSDDQLTALLKTGDKGAYTEVFNRYYAPLYAHAFNKLRDEEDASDVVQDMFAKLWIKRSLLDSENNLVGYLFKGVRNATFDLIKHKKIVSTYEASFNGFAASSQVMTDHLIREKQFAGMIEREIAALPSRMREVFELRRQENLSNKEIAARMGITESTVADQMKKAIKLLKTRIGLALILVSSADVQANAGTVKKDYIFFYNRHPQSTLLNRNISDDRLRTFHNDIEKNAERTN